MHSGSWEKEDLRVKKCRPMCKIHPKECIHTSRLPWYTDRMTRVATRFIILILLACAVAGVGFWWFLLFRVLLP